jgi:hypothetical protein
MAIILTPGQAGDNLQLLPLLDQVAVARDGPGRPRKRPERVLADKAYSHPRPARRCVSVRWRSPALSASIRSSVGVRRAPEAGGHPPSIQRSTPTATSSSAV